ncbi:MAG: PAS domain-containing protein, partial [Bacteroidota bacterium]
MLARFLLGMAVFIQGAAAILTFRLARKTELRLIWSLITGALLLLTARRAYTFALVVQGERTLGLMENLGELAYAALFFLGLFLLHRLLFTSQGKEAHAVAYGAQVRDILESINEAFFALDEHLVFTYFNHAAEQLTGLKREDVLGKPLLNAFPEGRAFEATYQKALAEQQARTFVEYYPKPLDAWFEVRVFPQSRGLTVYFI